MKEKQQIVRQILMDYPKTRDNDFALMVEFWKIEDPRVWIATFHTDYTLSDFLRDFVECKFTSPESITRFRRLAQEKYPETRGAKYLDRHLMAKKVAEQMGMFDKMVELFKPN